MAAKRALILAALLLAPADGLASPAFLGSQPKRTKAKLQGTFAHREEPQQPPEPEGPCHTAVEGDACHKEVTWAMTKGIVEHKFRYPGLHRNDAFEAFQNYLHKRLPGVCPKACEVVRPQQRMEACHTTVEGEGCHDEVVWAMGKGFHQNPSWYPGLTSNSSFEDFQMHLHNMERLRNTCAMPCNAEGKTFNLDPTMRKEAEQVAEVEKSVIHESNQSAAVGDEHAQKEWEDSWAAWKSAHVAKAQNNTNTTATGTESEKALPSMRVKPALPTFAPDNGQDHLSTDRNVSSEQANLMGGRDGEAQYGAKIAEEATAKTDAKSTVDAKLHSAVAAEAQAALKAEATAKAKAEEAAAAKADAKADAEIKAAAGAEALASAKAATVAKAEAEAEATASAEFKAAAEAQAQAALEAAAKAKAKAEAAAKAEAESKADADIKVAAEADALAAAKAAAEAAAKAESKAAADAEFKATADAEAQAASEAETEATAKVLQAASAEAESRADVEFNAAADAEAQASARVAAEAAATADAEATAKADAAAAAKEDAEFKAAAAAEAQAAWEAAAKAEVEAAAAASAEAESKADAEFTTEAEAEAQSALEAAAKAEAKAEAAASAEAEARADVEFLAAAEAEALSAAKAAAEASAKAEAEATAKAEAEAEARADVEFKAAAEAEAQAALEAAAKIRATADAAAKVEADAEADAGFKAAAEAEAQQVKAGAEFEADEAKEGDNIAKITKALGEAAAKADAEFQASLEMEAQAALEAAAKAKTEAEDSAKSEAEAKADADFKAAAEAEARSAAKVWAEVAAKAKAKADFRIAAQADAETVKEGGSKAKVEAGVKTTDEARTTSAGALPEEDYMMVEAEAKEDAEFMAAAEAEAQLAKAEFEAAAEAEFEADAKAEANAEAKEDAQFKADAETEAYASLEAKAKTTEEAKTAPEWAMPEVDYLTESVFPTVAPDSSQEERSAPSAKATLMGKSEAGRVTDTPELDRRGSTSEDGLLDVLKAPEDVLDRKTADELNAWVHETNKATQDLVAKEMSTEGSALGEAVETNPTELTASGAASEEDYAPAGPIEAPNGMRAWLDQAAKANEELDEETRTVMQELADTARRGPETKTRVEQELEMLENMIKEWDNENETSVDEFMRRMTAIAFRKAVRREGLKAAKSEDEKDLARAQRLIDGTDPKNPTAVGELAAALAKTSSFTRRVGKLPAEWASADRSEEWDWSSLGVRPSWDWTEEDTKKFWSWLKRSDEESIRQDVEVDAVEDEFREYLRRMTPRQESVMHKELEKLEEMWDKYGFENQSATAEDVVERLDTQTTA